jgi:hypothetical protein
MFPWSTWNATNAIRVPSGDHDGSNSWKDVLSVSAVSACVTTSIATRSEVPFVQQRSTAIRVPSGDQVGLPSTYPLFVSRLMPVPSGFIR